jgi:hypothetical protein
VASLSRSKHRHHRPNVTLSRGQLEVRAERGIPPDQMRHRTAIAHPQPPPREATDTARLIPPREPGRERELVLRARDHSPGAPAAPAAATRSGSDPNQAPSGAARRKNSESPPGLQPPLRELGERDIFASKIRPPPRLTAPISRSHDFPIGATTGRTQGPWTPPDSRDFAAERRRSGRPTGRRASPAQPRKTDSQRPSQPPVTFAAYRPGSLQYPLRTLKYCLISGQKGRSGYQDQP